MHSFNFIKYSNIVHSYSVRHNGKFIAVSKWVIVSFLYICFCRCYPGCRSSLAAYYTKQFLRSYDFVGSLKNRRFGGKRTTKAASAGTHREALSRLLMAAIPLSTYKQVKLDIRYRIICPIILLYCLKFIKYVMFTWYSATDITVFGVGRWDFPFWPFLGWFFGFCTEKL